MSFPFKRFFVLSFSLESYRVLYLSHVAVASYDHRLRYRNSKSVTTKVYKNLGVHNIFSKPSNLAYVYKLKVSYSKHILNSHGTNATLITHITVPITYSLRKLIELLITNHSSRPT